MNRAKTLKGQKTVQLGALIQLTEADAPSWRLLPARCSLPASNPRGSPKPSRGGPNAGIPSFREGAGGGKKAGAGDPAPAPERSRVGDGYMASRRAHCQSCRADRLWARRPGRLA